MALRAKDLPPAMRKRLGAKAPHKYRAQPVWIDGIRFDSQREAKRWGQLLMLVKAGEIDNLQLQPKYPIAVNGVPIAIWRGDFRYRVVKTGEWKVEDAKGVRTPTYRLKRKLVEALHGVSIIEV